MGEPNQWDSKRTTAGKALEAMKYGVDLPPDEEPAVEQAKNERPRWKEKHAEVFGELTIRRLEVEGLREALEKIKASTCSNISPEKFIHRIAREALGTQESGG